MGFTSGFKVYRSKKRYVIRNIYSGAYLDSLGLEVLHEIPRGVSKEEFKKWVRSTREILDAKFKTLDSDSRKEEYTTEEPLMDYEYGEWIYEINLDYLTFFFNHIPMFRLDNMPPDDVFLRSISFNHFGHHALHEHTPVQYRHKWRAPPPLPHPKSSMAYKSCPNRSSTSSIHELLGTPMALSAIERARAAFVGPLITRFMIERDVGLFLLRVLEAVSGRVHIPDYLLRLALTFVNFAVGPPNPSLPCNSSGITWDFIWIRKDVCLRFTTHLDDEGNLQASIGDLIHHINETRTAGTFYGIVCSILHCAIVRFDKDERGTSFAHTPPLQFLPSAYAREICTPGIEALSRLGCQASGVEFLNSISEAHHRPRLMHGRSRTMASKVPVEIWRNIGEFITSPIDLVNLAHISPQALSAAGDLARYPWILGYRLVDTVGSISPIPETTEQTSEEEIQQYYIQLGRAQFTAVKGGRHVTVELSQERGRTSNTFKVKSYLIYCYQLDRYKEPHICELCD